DGQIPPVLSDTVMKAMALDPAHRYPSVRDLQKDIEAYQNGLVWHLVLDDDFTDPNVTSRWQIPGGDYEVKPGELRLRGGQPQMLLLRRDLPGDVRIEFDCHQEGAYLNDIGCVLGAIPMPTAWDTLVSGYQFKYGARDNSLNIIARGEKILSEHAASPLVSGKYYHVCVERIGQHLKFIVNDMEVFNLIDPEPLTGSDRTVVGLIGWLSDTRYAHIKVYSLGTPWKADVIDIAERHLQKGNYGTAMDLFNEIMLSFPDAPRMERARRGYQTAEYRNVLASTLPSWQEQLKKAWPDIDFKLRVDNEGLSLDIPGESIHDLTPLQGIPLNALRISWNRVADLEPLRHMPLKLLHCENNPVRSLEPLKAMTLNNLKCDNCAITSLAPLRDMPITSLCCSGNPLEDGLEPLRGMPLVWLSCVNSHVESLDPLKGTSLTSLFADANRITDLGPLAGMSLSVLTCSGNRIQSLDPLKGMPLNALHCGANQIRSLEPLRDMPLNSLSCQNNLIESLDPLKGMALSALLCGADRFRSIAPLIKNPPKSFMFDCDSLPTEEMQWVLDTWSRDFRLNTYANSMKVLLAIRKGDLAQLRFMAVTHEGHRYLLIPKFVQWTEAKELCERFGGHLATITSREENDFLSTFFPFGGSWFWIGLEVTDEGPGWITHEPFVYSAFFNNQHAAEKGPKIYSCTKWMHDVIPEACNCFMIEWDS
ncbi:MAG: lectin-like protein, partial [Pseudomonadota bacterium]